MAPWQLAPDLPWQVFSSPAEQWATQPSFVLGELAFYLLAALSLWHALRNGGSHRLAWLAALLAGTANDVIFMALPLVDNFWQAQAMIMLTPRLPLYIPCVYICFLYLPTVALWRVRGLPALARSALTGLLAILFYAPYDAIGVRFLWWTWHDSDPPIAERLLGVPIGSTLWVILFAGSFSWLLARAGLRPGRTLGWGRALGALGLVLALSTVLMVAQMTLLQPLDGGVPGPRGLALAVALALGLGAWGMRGGVRRWSGRGDRLLLPAILGYYALLLGVGLLADPVAHRSASLHQTVGPCDVQERDITGQSRRRYLCVEGFEEAFSLCGRPPPPGSRWYEVCGLPIENRPRWLAALGGLSLGGGLGFALLLGGRERRDAQPDPPTASR